MTPARTAQARTASARTAQARIAALVCAALAGAVIAISVVGGAAAPAAPMAAPLSTATVVRTDLATSALTGGTLGYAPAAPVVNQLTGTYTQLPAEGTKIAAGGTLYRVDNGPVVLMKGSTPAWRALSLGVTDGPDIAELQSNLITLGDADGLLSAPTGHFDLATTYAVERWQRAQRDAVTGEVPLGDVVFLPTSVRVGATTLAPGEAATPGQQPYQVTTASRTVTVPLNSNLPTVQPGEEVSIILPSGTPIRGRATVVTAQTLTVVPARPALTGSGTNVAVQVSLTAQLTRHVLAVPVSALLALAGGGYALEVVEPSGAHRLVGVSTGTFSGSRVQVSGAAIGPGTRVVVAQ